MSVEHCWNDGIGKTEVLRKECILLSLHLWTGLG